MKKLVCLSFLAITSCGTIDLFDIPRKTISNEVRESYYTHDTTFNKGTSPGGLNEWDMSRTKVDLGEPVMGMRELAIDSEKENVGNSYGQ